VGAMRAGSEREREREREREWEWESEFEREREPEWRRAGGRGGAHAGARSEERGVALFVHFLGPAMLREVDGTLGSLDRLDDNLGVQVAAAGEVSASRLIGGWWCKCSVSHRCSLGKWG